MNEMAKFDPERWIEATNAELDAMIRNLRKTCKCNLVQVIVTYYDEESNLTYTTQRNGYAKSIWLDKNVEKNTRCGANTALSNIED